jgi:hypothetical protein
MKIEVIHSPENFASAKLLSNALAKCGNTVSLLDGSSSRKDDQITDTSDDKALCVIVIWTRHSSDTHHHALQTLAREAQSRGALIHVMMQKTRLPEPFRETAYVDLIGWKGSIENVYFEDLLTACSRIEQGKTVGELQFLVRKRIPKRLIATLPAAALVVGIWADVASVQKQVCSVSFVQPSISDMCGAIGLGGKPTKKEREAWALVDQNSCRALGAFIREFDDGVYYGQADALLNVAGLSESEKWAEKQKFQRVFVGVGMTAPRATESLARDSSVDWMQQLADEKCSHFAASSDYEFIRAEVKDPMLHCEAYSDGFRCEGEAPTICTLNVRTIERCED